MAFEDLQKAFIEADLEKLRERVAALKSKDKTKSTVGKKASKDKKKTAIGKKPNLTKGSVKSKEKAGRQELEKKRIEAEKVAKEEEAKAVTGVGKKSGSEKENKEKGDLKSNPSYEASVDSKIDLSLYQQKFYLPEDKERVSGLDQLESINKLPLPEDKIAPKKDKEQPAEQDKPNVLQTHKLTAEDRVKRMREALGVGTSGASIAPPKTPITAEVKAAKEAASKNAGASMNAILALHSNKKPG